MISNILYLKRLVRLDYVYFDIIRQKQWNSLRKTISLGIIIKIHLKNHIQLTIQ